MKIHDDGFTQTNLLGWQSAADPGKCARSQNVHIVRAPAAPFVQRVWREKPSAALLPKASVDQTLRQPEREFQECGNISKFCLCRVTLSPATEG